jgi:hypothetical protein
LRRLPGTYESLLAAVQDEMNALLESGAEDPAHGIIRTADFREWFYLVEGPGSPGDPAAPAIFVGVLNSLAPAHWLRGILPAEECYQKNGRPCLLLGRPLPGRFTNRQPKPLYFTEQALYWTKYYREQQRNEEMQRAREKAERERLEKRRRDIDPNVAIPALTKRITELEAALAAKDGRN